MTLAADPRLRARKVAVARQAGHRRLVLLSAGLSLVALVVSALMLLHSSLLSARVLHLRGALHESRAEVLSVTGLDAHPPLVDLSQGAVARALERLPWVRTARVVKDWPTGVTISLTERHPVAYVALKAGRSALIDQTGRILAVVPGVPSGLVAIVPVGPPGAPGTRLRVGVGVLEVAARLPGSLRSKVAALSFGAAGVQARLVNGPEVIFGTATSLGAKLTALSTVLDKVSLHGIVTLDVADPSQPLLTR
jgi:cell division protein FtsQ